MSKTPSDPTQYRRSQHSRMPSIARHAGPCDMCPHRINPGDEIQRVKGKEVHARCAGRE